MRSARVGRIVGSTWLQWIVLSALTGSPIGSAIFLLVFWLVVDRFTWGLLPDPFRALGRLQRAARLERTIGANPHDGRARLELAGLLVERGQHRRALDVIRPNVEKGDDDAQTLFTMGVACLGAGFHAQGEKLLETVEEKSPGFRVNEIDLVRGRSLLARKDFAGAKAALERLVQVRQGSVQGRVLLSQALLGLGDDGAAALMRDAAWAEYVHAPRFQRRQERWWAWRARPSRPLTILALVLAGLLFTGLVVMPKLSQWAAQQRAAGFVDPGLADPDE